MSALSAWKSSRRKYTSPRTSISAGTGNSGVPVSSSGTSASVRMLSVMSSPVRPSPRVSPRVSLPFSYSRLTASPSIFSSHR